MNTSKLRDFIHFSAGVDLVSEHATQDRDRTFSHEFFVSIDELLTDAEEQCHCEPPRCHCLPVSGLKFTDK
jgi:hypothetical protein